MAIGNYSNRKDWKATQWDYDFVRAQSADRCLFCLSKQQVAALLASFEVMRWRTRWYSPTNTAIDEDWLDAFIADLETELMTDHCDIDTALTNINNNLTTINNDITTINNNIVTVNANLTVVNNNLTVVENNVTNLTTINNTVNVTVNLPNQTFSSNSTDRTPVQNYARYNAFCQAMTEWIASEGYIVLYGLNASVSMLNAYIAAVFTGGLSLIAGIQYHGTTYTATIVNAAFTDSAALNDVVCFMVNYLYNLAPTYGNFVAALNAYVPPAYPNNRFVIHEVLAIAIDFFDAFGSFASIMDLAYQKQLALNPTNFVCLPCGTVNLGCGYNTWDFTQLQLLPWTIKRGVLTAGQGIVGVPVPGDSSYAFEANLYFPGGCKPTVTTYIHFTLLGLPNNTNGSFYFETYAIVGGVETLQEYAFYISQATYPTPIVTSKEWTFGPLVNYKTLSRIRIVSNTSFNTPSGGNFITPVYSALQKVVFNGTP